MIDHLKLLIVFCNLFVGFGLAIYIKQLHQRVDFPPLKPVFYQVLFNNLLVCLLLVSRYYDVNIDEEVFQLSPTATSVIHSFLIYLFFVGFSYSSLLGLPDFPEKTLPARTLEKSGHCNGFVACRCFSGATFRRR